MKYKSKLIYGFRTNDIEDARAKLEAALQIAFTVYRDDDTGIRYNAYRENDAGIRNHSGSRAHTPLLALFPNYDEDEEGQFFSMERFKEYPMILTILNWEGIPNVIDTIAAISGLNAELLDRRQAGVDIEDQ